MSEASQLALALPPRPPPGRPGGATLDERNATEYVEMTCRSILNWVEGTHVCETYSVNPYRGCEFGCAYCYARYTHEFLDLTDPEAFERRIFVKVDAGAAMRRDLRRKKDVAAGGIALGTATDPYQPAERIFRVTRRILEALLPLSGIPLSVVTKSALIERDVDLLAELSRRHDLTVNFSCIAMDPWFQRVLEPRAPTPARRFHALSTLAAAGVRCGILVAPILPAITDADENLRAVLAAAKAAGASTYGAVVLFLTSSARKRFFPWLAQHAPDLHARYAARYGSGMYEDEVYRLRICMRIQRFAREVGLSRGRVGYGRNPIGTDVEPQASRELSVTA